MTPETLVEGATLPEHRVVAHMPRDAVENKIHEDALARELGFRGGLVPGVTVYAWMTHPVVAALGPEWLERGTFRARFASPVYFEEPIAICATVSSAGPEEVAIDVQAVNGAGVACAMAQMALPARRSDGAPDPARYPKVPLPADRPPVSREILASRTALGSPELLVDEATARAFLERVSEPLPLYAGAGAPAHPGLYLDQANRALSRSVVVSPWIHVESEGRHLGLLRVGERLETRARIERLFERKGHEFVELDVLALADGRRPVAAIRHVAIYQLRRSA
jgi:hypothetical protein